MKRESDKRVCAALLFALFGVCACSAEQGSVRHDKGDNSGNGRHVGGLRSGPWTDYYANGQKQSEGSYENDVQTGSWTYWFESGHKEMEGSFADERRDGEWKSWYENGALRAEGRFERGFEEGLWRFHDSSGALEHEGTFELGKPVLRWTYYHPDGTVRATGNYLAGVKVGDWIMRDATGNRTDVSYPFPAGCELIEEFFSDSTLERAGFVRDGQPAGRWMSHHQSGKLRLECDFVHGEPNGRARAWRDDGSLLASGSLENGSMIGEWFFSRGSSQEKLDFKVARPRQTFSGNWSPANSADEPGSMTVETWVAELCSPCQPAPIRSVSVATPSAATRSAPESAPVSADVVGIPARAQPWTEYELSALSELVTLYGAGKSRGARDEEDWQAPVLHKRNSKPLANVTKPADLIGRPLPLKRFTTADGSEIDLDDYVGKKNVVVTILRGFGGQVCVYCTAQTKGLADYSAEFAALGTEVVVVFPGPASGLAAFLEAYKRTFGPDEKLPYKLLYDTDLTLTRALHIEDNIAVPTSILLDRKGIIRWCHVAKDHADRPSAQQVIDQITALPKDMR